MKKIINSGAFIAFAIGFALYILVMLPELIYNKGILIIDGDFKNQMLPFACHIRDSIFSGNVIWDGSTGLGGQFLSLYAYYNLFSPFSVFYLIVPRELIIYIIPYVSALKYGVGSCLGYIYIRRFTENRHFAVIGGLLYMFSSFSGYNICFHFDDIIAFFPLLLIALEELCTKRRYGLFALTVGFMAVLNYYFFFGQVIFVVIYFFARGIFDKKFGLSIKLTCRTLLEGLIGVMIAAAVLIPVGSSLAATDKATEFISSDSMLFYDNIFHYLKIIQSAFMVPDGLRFTSLFPENDTYYPFGVLFASVAAYLPLFSLTGVISFIWAKRKSWMSVMLALCTVFAFVPVLNQAFSAFNTNYYARWYYMPVLVAVLATIKALEDGLSFKPGIIACGAVLAGLTIYYIFADVEHLSVIYGNGRNILNPMLTIVNIAVSAVSLLLVIIITRSKRDKEFIPKLYLFSIIGAYLCYGMMAFYIVGNYEYKSDFIEYCSAADNDSIELENCSRISTIAGARNLNQIWGCPSVNYFNSIYDPGFERFKRENGIFYENGLYMDIDKNSPELAGIVSVKYFLLTSPPDESSVEAGAYGPFSVYENEYYVPMGFTYDKMISYDRFASISSYSEKQRVYAEYMVADAPADFEGILTLCDDEYKPAESDDEYLELINEKSAGAAYSVEETPEGYRVEISTEKDTVMCLAVSYNTGWKACVDGEEAGVYQINNGLLGVILPEGEHEVELKYTVSGAVQGVVVSAAGVLLLLGYVIVSRRIKRCTEEKT